MRSDVTEIHWSHEAMHRVEEFREIMPHVTASRWEEIYLDAGDVTDHEDRLRFRRAADILIEATLHFGTRRAEQLAREEAEESGVAVATVEVELRHAAGGLHQATLHLRIAEEHPRSRQETP